MDHDDDPQTAQELFEQLVHLQADTQEFQEAFDDRGNLRGHSTSVTTASLRQAMAEQNNEALAYMFRVQGQNGSWNAKAFLNPKVLDDGSTAAMYANHSCDPNMTAAFVKLADLGFDERQCALLAHPVSSRVNLKATLDQGIICDVMCAVQSVIVLQAKQPIAKGAELTFEYGG